MRERSCADILARTAEHLSLVAVSLSAAILVAVPLGVAAARWRGLGQLVLAVVGIVQTVPSLALAGLHDPTLRDRRCASHRGPVPLQLAAHRP